MKWIIASLALIGALFIAGVTGWFSIVGMMALFGGSALSAGIMMSSLEFGKLITAAWLKNEWDNTTWLLRYSLLSMVVVLIFITSLGIFGFLSKAHIEQGAPVGNTTAKIERIDKRIAREQSKIQDSQIVINQLDEAVNTLIEYDRIRGPDGSIETRKLQQEQRNYLASIITEAEDNIEVLEDEKFEFSQAIREYEVEVGPVKYIAALIYDDNATRNNLDSAVRAVIIILIFVLDPLAILLLVSANQSFIRLLRENKKVETKSTTIDRIDEPPEMDLKKKEYLIDNNKVDTVCDEKHTESSIKLEISDNTPTVKKPHGLIVRKIKGDTND